MEQQDPEAIYPDAEKAVDALTEYLPTDDERWAHSAMVELRLAVGDLDGAVESCRKLLASPDVDRFWLERLRGRLERVWLLDQNTRAGARLLPILRVRQAQLEGGSLTLDQPVEDFVSSHEKFEAFEKVWGTESYSPAAWMQNALQVARSVGRVEGPSVAVGTGVLIDGDWIAPGWHGQVLFLTAAHVCSSLLSPSDPGLSPQECQVTFALPNSEQDTGRLSVSVASEVFTSPIDELNVTLLRLDDLPLEFAPPMTAALPETRFTVLPGDQVSVVGYPHGGELQFSLTNGGVTGVDDASLMYTNPTSPGSSGSPVFDSDWRLVGLHYAADRGRKVNMARRMDRIIAALRETGLEIDSGSQTSTRDTH